MTPGASSNSVRSSRRRAPGAQVTTWSGNTTPSSAASRRNGKPATRSLGVVAEAQRQPEVDRELEVDVEELGAGLQRAEVAGEVAHVEAPHDRPLDLGPALAPHLVEVGVVPRVLDGAGEPAVAVEQARRVGDRSPAVGVELGVEREVHADVVAPVAGGGVAGPRARHHQRRARGQPVTQRVVGGHVAGVGEAEVVARDDQQLGVGGMPEPLGERGHGRIKSYRRPFDGRSAASVLRMRLRCISPAG